MTREIKVGATDKLTDDEIDALITEKGKLMFPAAQGDKDASNRIVQFQNILLPLVQGEARKLTGSTKGSS